MTPKHQSVRIQIKNAAFHQLETKRMIVQSHGEKFGLTNTSWKLKTALVISTALVVEIKQESKQASRKESKKASKKN